MYRLNLPSYDIKIKEEGTKRAIFDILRQKYVALTPEEWVRQHFVHYLIEHKHYPKALFGNEIELKIGDTRLRCDSILYTKELQPRMIIEYKAPTVDITQQVFEQISRYNIRLRVKWLIVSNGLQHYCCRIDYERGTYQFVEDIPTFEDIKSE